MGLLGGLVDVVGLSPVLGLLLLGLSIGQFVIGVNHGDRAIRQSEGRHGKGFRWSACPFWVQDIVMIADYINATEQVGLLPLMMVGRVKE